MIDEYNTDHLAHFYEYDPVTGYKVGELHIPPEAADPTDPNITGIAPPEYDPDIEEVVYILAEDRWEIEVAADPLRDAKDIAKGEVDRSVRIAINRNVTSLAVTSGLYDLKYAEAIAYTTATDPVLTDYPFLEVETTVTNATADECANTFITKHNEWIAKLVELEHIRLTAKRDIEAVSLSLLDATQAKNEIARLAASVDNQLRNL